VRDRARSEFPHGTGSRELVACVFSDTDAVCTSGRFLLSLMGYLNQFFTECHEFAGGFAGKSVLVAGCGPGLDCIPFVEEGASVTGLDIGDDIGVAYSNPSVRYHRASIEGCDLDSAQYDVVFSVATMEHVHKIEAAYHEMVRLVRPGGTIYALAAPLWNSRKGHHLECLYSFPWIHLRRTAKQIAALGDERGITHNGMALRDVVDWLFTSTYFNRAPSKRYVEACAFLPVSRILRNEFWMDGAEDLTVAVRSELALKGYTPEELLATSHRLIAMK
jgi:SAM-dependent methyltransferase